MLDANFRLKLKDRSVVDPSLGQGLSYYVKERPYLDHVKASGPQTEVRESFAAYLLINRI